MLKSFVWLQDWAQNTYRSEIHSDCLFYFQASSGLCMDQNKGLLLVLYSTVFGKGNHHTSLTVLPYTAHQKMTFKQKRKLKIYFSADKIPDTFTS